MLQSASTPRSKAGITVEFLATSVDLPPAHEASPLAPSEAVTLARDIGAKVAEKAHIPHSRLDSLDFHALAVNTGATGNPTLVVSYIDPNAEEAASHGDKTSYLFAIGDKIGGDYTPTFSATVNGSAAKALYRRYVDHIDLDGNGIDAIVLEGWQYGGDTYPMIMRYKDGRWVEIFRGHDQLVLGTGNRTLDVRRSRFDVRGSTFDVRGSRFEVRRSSVRGSRFEVRKPTSKSGRIPAARTFPLMGR